MSVFLSKDKYRYLRIIPDKAKSLTPVCIFFIISLYSCITICDHIFILYLFLATNHNFTKNPKACRCKCSQNIHLHLEPLISLIFPISFFYVYSKLETVSTTFSLRTCIDIINHIYKRPHYTV